MDDKKKFKPNEDLKLMDQVREVLRYYHYAYRTEQTYCDWVKRYLKFHGYEKHPREMGAAEVERYLSHLATEGKVAVSTQRQALNAIVFLYRDVLDIDLGGIAPIRSKKHRKPPTVLELYPTRRGPSIYFYHGMAFLNNFIWGGQCGEPVTWQDTGGAGFFS